MDQKINAEQFLKSTRIGLWRIDLIEGQEPQFYADAVMDELLGIEKRITPEERFRFHRAHIHPDDMQLFQEYSDRLADTRTEIVYRYIHPNSGEMIVRCAGMKDDAVKGYVSIIGTHQDISETMRLEQEKQAEHRLAEQNNALRQEKVRSEDYYRKILDMQGCGVLAYTLPGHRIIHMNAQALQMYGYERVEDIQSELGNALRRISYPDSRTVERLKGLRNQDDAVDYECVITQRNLVDRCHALAKSRIIVIPSGERAVITTFLDVSDMVVLKNALKKAEEGSRAKSSFLFAMSHDLRTPMNAIIGYADLMERHWGEETLTTGYLHKLQEAGSFLMELIGNVLEVARIESGKETLTETPWDLLEVNDTLDILLDNEISEKKLTFHRKIDIRHKDIYCDVLKVREILMNLLSNAIKYTPEGGTISLSITELPSEKEGYALYQTVVQDNGLGIGKEYISHLFEAFTREKSSSENGIMGTGLGLKIVKSFVDLMDGTISVESEVGQGTKFTLRIAHRLVLEDEERQQQTENEREHHSQDLSGLRILLAEDNKLNAEIAMTLLKDIGAEVELAEDGNQVLSMLKQVPEKYYDLILMDIQMPHLNGYEATKTIRAWSDERKDIRIIAMTANAFDEDRQAAYQAGMDGYVTKPIDINKTVETIREVLRVPKGMVQPGKI